MKGLWQLATGVTRFRPGHGCAGPKVSADIKKTVIERDQFSCRSCRGSVVAAGDVEVIDPAAPLDVANLVTVCPICAGPLRLHAATQAILIYCPGVTQAAFAHLARAALIANLELETRPMAELFYLGLDRCKEEAVRRLGTKNPAILADVLMNSPGTQDNINKEIAGIRLFTTPTALFDYAQQLKAMPGAIPAREWGKL